MNEQQLLDLKQDIDESKDEVKELEGRRKFLLEKLKEDWNCDTVEEAEEILEGMQQDIKDMEKKIKKGTQKLEEKYEFK